MIIQTGMRTDIPAFYSRWFLNRLKAGYVLVRNPYNSKAVTKYSLSPSVVDVIAFCTKNPAPMLAHLDELKAYGQYWFVTITPYEHDIEPRVPDKTEVIESFKRLSSAVGINSVGWRYDPIFITEKYNLEFHINAFREMAMYLRGYTDVCVISFIDIYKKVQKNFSEVGSVSKADRITIGKAFYEVGKNCGIEIKSCAEGTDLAPIGIKCDGCMTKETFEKVLGKRLSIPKQNSIIRNTCNCLLGNDIGAYDSCPHMCKYCYANTNKTLVKNNIKKHDPNSPFLVGNSEDGDIIHEAKQESWIDANQFLGLHLI